MFLQKCSQDASKISKWYKQTGTQSYGFKPSWDLMITTNHITVVIEVQNLTQGSDLIYFLTLHWGIDYLQMAVLEATILISLPLAENMRAPLGLYQQSQIMHIVVDPPSVGVIYIYIYMCVCVCVVASTVPTDAIAPYHARSLAGNIIMFFHSTCNY